MPVPFIAGAVLGLVAAGSPAVAPSPSPTPIPVIDRMEVNGECTAVRENVAQTVVGLRLNDGLIAQGQIVMAQIGYDAVVDPQSASVTGGAGASSQLDDVRLGHLAHALAQNLDRIEDLLNDPRRFPPNPSTNDERALAAAKASLEAVAADQRRALQLLSGTLDANELDEIESRCDPVDCGAGRDSVGGPRSREQQQQPPIRLTAPQLLDVVMRSERQAETRVTAPVVDVANRCRGSH